MSALGSNYFILFFSLFSFLPTLITVFLTQQREIKQESSSLWVEPYRQATSWEPCADRKVITDQGIYGNEPCLLMPSLLYTEIYSD